MKQFFQGLWLDVLILCVFQTQYRVCGICPDQDILLSRWSSHTSWDGGKKPALNDPVTINRHILLDETPPELHHITIEPNGRLVWSQEGDYNLTLKYILIYGSMEIGSEDCTFYRKTHILLRGIRGEYSILLGGKDLFDEKFIGVAPGGTLEIHGEKKLSWTKLTKTVPKLALTNGLVVSHQDSPLSKMDNWKPGIAAYVFDEKTAKVLSSKYYYLGGSEPTLSRTDPVWLTQLINDLQYEKIIAMAVNRNIKHSAVDLKPIFDALKDLGFSLENEIAQGGQGDAFVFIAQRGYPNMTKQILSPNLQNDFHRATATLTVGRFRYSVESFIDNRHPDQSMVDFRVTTVTASHPILNLLDDVTTWTPGDQLVLTSTDYDWQQAEVATVVPCSTCTYNQIKIELDIRYTHFGESIYNVDQRGEVALLTRNIVIEGEMEEQCQISNGNCDDFHYDTFGGHLKFVQGFKNVHLEGLELYHMGQQTEIGHYPVHFHICYDVDGVGNYSYPPYFRDSSVHHSFSRCVTIHGTSGVMVQDNVCYDSLGHSYFLEDGGEKRNTFDGNIGISTRKGKILISDSRPATYWMTNPINHLRNNVAAGSETYGIWYVFPDEPYGPSIGLGFMKKYESMHTPILEFDNNVAHSNGDTGLYADNKILQSTEASGSNEYSPRLRPLESNSAPALVTFTRPTLYKNRKGNMFLRGGWLKVDRGSFSDSAVGATFAKSDDQQQFLYNSVFLGESTNLGEPTKDVIGLNRSLPDPNDSHAPIQGFSFYDGPVYVENSWFAFFVRNKFYPVGAIGFHRNNDKPSSAISSVKGVKFGFYDITQGNRVYDGNSSINGYGDHDGDLVATVRDADGSLTGNVNSQIVRPYPFNMNAGCYVRSSWNMAVCPQSYGKLTVLLESQEGRGKTSPFVVRDDMPTVRETRDWKYPAQFLTILGGDYSYTIHWSHYVPHQIAIKGDGIEKGQWVRFGVCLPRDAQIDLFAYSPKYLSGINDWTSAASLAELEADIIGDKYFWDPVVGLLFFKFLNYNTRPAGDTNECPVSGCPHIRITVMGGNTLDGDCTQRAYNGTYNRNAPTEKKVLKFVNLPATLSSPSSTMGAGLTRPFVTRTRLNGNFGNWTEWTSCSINCLGGTQYRYRWCNRPIPQNGGKHCVGKSVESRKCDPNLCPIDGGWSDFGDWSRCQLTNGCHGFQNRQRTCSNPLPRNAGQYCEGSDEEVRPCDLC